MALPTYLELVNDILIRMREPEVTTVQENVLSKLIGKLVNDAKRQVEDAYNWSALTSTKTTTTTAATSSYSIVGSGSRFKVIDGYNTTSLTEMKPATFEDMNREVYSVSSVSTGSPDSYVFKGIDSNGDSKATLFPVPDAAYTIVWNLYIPQTSLSDNNDTLLVPSEPVILGAYARALVERGEDGGLNSSEAYGLYRSSLADAIAIESSRYIGEDAWEAV